MAKPLYKRLLIWAIVSAFITFALGYWCGVSHQCCYSDADIIPYNQSDTLAECRKVPELSNYVPVDTGSTIGLNLYYPNFSRIDLVCGKMPDKSNDSIIFMASAAYTSKELNVFSHSNIVGPHVSDGVFYVPVSKPKGAFSFYDNSPHFTYGDYTNDMKCAARKGGCAFSQDMIICNGELTQYDRDPKSKAYFRALCLLEDKLAIVDSKNSETFELFVSRLHHMNISNAIYMDMGGWSYSWYRDSNNNIIELGNRPNKFATNWLVFYK